MMLLNGIRNTLSCRPATLRMICGMALPCRVTSSVSRFCEWSVT
jgi:hypothetical protein